jgi:hypothetical protein
MCFLFLCVMNVFFQVAYLDRVDFGLKSLPDVVPRVLVWKGTRIRDYADLDKCSGNSFGKRPLKHVSYASKVQVIFISSFPYIFYSISFVFFYVVTSVKLFILVWLLQSKEPQYSQSTLPYLHDSSGRRQFKHVSDASKVQVISCFCSTLFYFLISSSSLQ